MHIFLDSSVLLAFCRSKNGASALIIDYCRHKKLKGYISKKVVAEVRKNNTEDGNAVGIQRFGFILNRSFLTIVQDGTGAELEKANSLFDNPKVTPVLVSAKLTPNIQFILSLDDGFFKPEMNYSAAKLTEYPSESSSVNHSSLQQAARYSGSRIKKYVKPIEILRPGKFIERFRSELN